MNKLITPEYKEQLTIKHQKKPWGGGGKSWIPTLTKHVDMRRISTALDYGCGRHTFKEGMAEEYPEVNVTEYDPGVPGFDTLDMSKEYGLVVCTDVMEHVEPEFTHTTLRTIEHLTGLYVLFNIVTTPCSSTLPDGRNTHINLMPVDQWEKALKLNFKHTEWNTETLERKGRLVCILRRRS